MNIGILPSIYNKPSKFINVLFLTTAPASGFVYSCKH